MFQENQVLVAHSKKQQKELYNSTEYDQRLEIYKKKIFKKSNKKIFHKQVVIVNPIKFLQPINFYFSAKWDHIFFLENHYLDDINQPKTSFLSQLNQFKIIQSIKRDDQQRFLKIQLGQLSCQLYDFQMNLFMDRLLTLGNKAGKQMHEFFETNMHYDQNYDWYKMQQLFLPQNRIISNIQYSQFMYDFLHQSKMFMQQQNIKTPIIKETLNCCNQILIQLDAIHKGKQSQIQLLKSNYKKNVQSLCKTNPCVIITKQIDVQSFDSKIVKIKMSYLLINLLYNSLDEAINSIQENGLPNIFSHSDYHWINYDYMRLSLHQIPSFQRFLNSNVYHNKMEVKMSDHQFYFKDNNLYSQTIVYLDYLSDQKNHKQQQASCKIVDQ